MSESNPNQAAGVDVNQQRRGDGSPDRLGLVAGTIQHGGVVVRDVDRPGHHPRALFIPRCNTACCCTPPSVRSRCCRWLGTACGTGWITGTGRWSHVTVLGYVALLGLVVCSVSGLVLMGEAVLGVRTLAFWRQAHLISTLVMLAGLLPHLFSSGSRRARAGRPRRRVVTSGNRSGRRRWESPWWRRCRRFIPALNM